MLWCFLLIGCFFLMFQRGKFAKYSYNYHTFAEWSLKISKHKTSQRSPVCSVLLFEIRKHNKPVISARIALVSTMNDPLQELYNLGSVFNVDDVFVQNRSDFNRGHNVIRQQLLSNYAPFISMEDFLNSLNALNIIAVVI